MHSEPIRARIRLFCVAVIAVAGFVLSPTPVAYAGAADNVWGWMWSSSAGWISMNCTDLGSCATVDYGVRLNDVPGSPGNANVTGYAWSETLGWICFGATCTGTTPEGGAAYAQIRALHNGKVSQVWGWAKLISLAEGGWISLNCDKDVGADGCGTSNHYVELDNALGVWNGGGANNHWAWNGNADGTGLGWVDTSTVNTSWIAAEIGTIIRPGGVFEPESLGGVCVNSSQCTSPHLTCNTGIGRCVLPGTHRSTFDIKFEGMSASDGYFLECELNAIDGDGIWYYTFGKELSYPSGRNVPDLIPPIDPDAGKEQLTYTVQSGDPIQNAYNAVWKIKECRLAGQPLVTACTYDGDCGAGEVCDEAPGSGKCRTVVARSGSRALYAHTSTWSGLGAAGDQYKAIKCNAGFPGNYFNNAAQCDFTADASFALSMRRGIPVEGICDDGIDNDNNGQIDCSDRYCKGISYICDNGPLPRTACTWGATSDFIGSDPRELQDCSSPTYGASGFYDVCCTRQPVAPGSPLSNISDGIECSVGEVNDGVYDCSCVNQAAFDADSDDDCFAPGYQTGDICCDASSNLIKQ